MSTTFEEEFGDWLAYATVSVEPFSGSGAWGATYGAPQEVPAFYDFQERTAKRADGSVVTTNTVLFVSVAHFDTLAPGSRVTIPGQADRYEVITRRSWPGDDTHVEVTLL